MDKLYLFKEALKGDFKIGDILDKYISLYGDKTPVWFENIDNSYCFIDIKNNKFKAVWTEIDGKVLEPILLETKNDKIRRLCHTLKNACDELLEIINLEKE